MLDITETLLESKETCELSHIERRFTFPKPPNAAWWRKSFSIRKQTAHLCYYLQHKIPQGRIIRLSQRYLVLKTKDCCADLTGISIRTFERARDEAVTAGLINYEVHKWAQKGEHQLKHIFIRPTDKFLEPFGVSVDDYDRYGLVTYLKKGRPKKGETAPSAKTMTPEDIEAVDRWNIATCREGGT